VEKYDWRAHNEVSAASGARVNPSMCKCNPRYPTFAGNDIMRQLRRIRENGPHSLRAIFAA
jgi:hypothetical protein